MADTLRLLLQTPHGAQWGSWPATIFASVTGYAALFFVLDRTGVLLPRKKLSRKDELDWNSRVISTINALVLVWGANPSKQPGCSPHLLALLSQQS